MSYYPRLDRELEPELFLIASIYREVPGFESGPHLQPYWVHNRKRTLIQDVRRFYDSLDPEILNRLKSSEIRQRVTNMLSTLSEREQKVLALLYGLQDGRVYRYTEATQSIPRVKEVSRFGRKYPQNEPVTRERLRQVELKALRRLRHPRRSRELRDYLKSLSQEMNVERAN